MINRSFSSAILVIGGNMVGSGATHLHSMQNADFLPLALAGLVVVALGAIMNAKSP